MIPFMTEDIYQNLVRSLDKEAPESIHLCDFPVANEAHIDKDLEAKMEEVLKVVVLVVQQEILLISRTVSRSDVCS